MADVRQRRSARSGSVTVLAFLREQIKNPDSANAAPHPKLSRLGVRLMSVVAKVFGHRRPLLAQGQSQSAVKVVVWSHTVGNGLCFGQ